MVTPKRTNLCEESQRWLSNRRSFVSVLGPATAVVGVFDPALRDPPAT